VERSRDASAAWPQGPATEAKGCRKGGGLQAATSLTSTSTPRPRRGGRIKRLQAQTSVQDASRVERNSVGQTSSGAPVRKAGTQRNNSTVCATDSSGVDSKSQHDNQDGLQRAPITKAAQPQEHVSGGVEGCDVDTGRGDGCEGKCAGGLVEVGQGLCGEFVANLVAESRCACRLPFLTGCAPVCYGAPTVFTRRYVESPCPSD
jgi:hypothetical protein